MVMIIIVLHKATTKIVAHTSMVIIINIRNVMIVTLKSINPPSLHRSIIRCNIFISDIIRFTIFNEKK